MHGVSSSALQLPAEGLGWSWEPEGRGKVGAGHGSTTCWWMGCGFAHFWLGRRIVELGEAGCAQQAHSTAPCSTGLIWVSVSQGILGLSNTAELAFPHELL